MRTWQCRPARLDDTDELEALQIRCVRQLGCGFYTDAELDAYIREFGTLDHTLIVEGTYFVVEDERVLIGCGGWSVREPHYASPSSAPEPNGTIPQIRGFFVHPERARQGIGRAIMAHVEAEIREAGYRQAALTAMLSGVPFYRSLCYRKTGNSRVKVAGGTYHLPSIDMIKQLDRPTLLA